MEQASKLHTSALDLIAKYFGQSTAEVYDKFFTGEPDSVIITSINEIMVDYVGEEKAKTEISKIMENLAV
jgi:hypothetical protein